MTATVAFVQQRFHCSSYGRNETLVISSSCGDTPYTKNTKEIRKFLEEREYFPLRFFQGGEYIYPIVSTMANAQSTWKVKDYSTFDESKKINMPYLMDSPLSEEDFKLAIIKADSNYC